MSTTATPRVLVITKTDFADPRDGGTLRVSAIVDRLRAVGCHVDAVAVRNADGSVRGRGSRPGSFATPSVRAAARVARAVATAGSMSVARWYSPSAAAEIAGLLATNEYHCVVIEYSQLLIYRGLLGNLPVVLDMHNVEFELLANYAATAPSRVKRVIARYEAARVRRVEQRAAGAVDAIVTVSDRDAAMVRAWSAGAAEVAAAPNGVVESAFTVDAAVDGPKVVFVGHLGWQPNIDAGRWLVEQVWPIVREHRPDATLALVGRSPAKSLLDYDGTDGVSVHADVPSTFPYLAAAAVATAPLLAAGGTRLKILEALATGTPVVATSLGALGLEHLAGEGGLVIDDTATDFAGGLVEFLSGHPDPDKVRASVEDYRWQRTLAPLVELVIERARLRTLDTEVSR